MTAARARSTAAAALLSVLVLLLPVVPGPGPQAPAVDAARLGAAVEDGTVLVTGAVEDVARAVAGAGGRVLGHLPFLGVTVVDVSEAGAAEIAAVPGLSVSANASVALQDADATSLAHPADDQGPATLRADKLWKHGVTGEGIGIAVLDTGVSNVGELAGRVLDGIDLSGDGSGAGQDAYGHGTPVASLAAGSSTGVAPGAHVVPVKIAGRNGATDVVRLLTGIDWIARHAAEYDIRVVNLSLGSAPSPLVDAAVQRLWDLGLVVVVAAGNGGPGGLGTPASNTHAITVGATQGQDTTRTADDVIAPWSADGVDRDGREKPDVVAPGQSLVVAGAPGSWAYDEHPEGHLGGGRQRVSGTSFAAGLVSGAAALLLDANPSWSNDEVLGQLVATGARARGTAAPTPQLDRAARAMTPVAGNADASGADPAATQLLDLLGPPSPAVLAAMVGNQERALELGRAWYGEGWDAEGPYETSWLGFGWYGFGWYGDEWAGFGWYGDEWAGFGWYGDWSGFGWYAGGWSSAGWA